MRTGAAEGSHKWGGTEERDPKGSGGSGVLGEGVVSPHQLEGLGEQCKLTHWGLVPAEINFCVFNTTESIYLGSKSI